MSDTAPKIWGISMKYISLVTLTLQNSSLILVMHYSRVMPGFTRDSRYLASTAVLMNELIKLFICLTAATYESHGRLGLVFKQVFSHDCWKLAIPAGLYTLQNSLQYVAVANLDAATFQVTYQLKIITTALFSVILLRRQLFKHQWVSLVILTLGIAIVQVPAEAITNLLDVAWSMLGKNDQHHPHSPPGRKLESRMFSGGEAAASEMNGSVGMIAVLTACSLSGLAGVYFEKVLKGTSTTLWVRNIQLSFFSLFPAALIGCGIYDREAISEFGFFHGYNGVVWTAILLQAFGGIVVALCVKYADNIVKNFATSISIIISCIASVMFFDFHVSLAFITGSIMVIYATYLYGRPAPNPKNLIPLSQSADSPSSGSESLEENSIKLNRM
ncbi:nucleotide-sugar transporter [Nadsonia fulvescens var. elongata DSM 6958]|uniref:Nucleotide-sugar transporter n=1 Tax=Nadsonia fulvescens var. elongata DSM 6958 TaxID=857566 RepID=A0A1E3PEZ1_9ASCO|nr:nucleotide-sugar transporter [Nadsonia fulvescens var. elongata DSM 6958]